MKYCTEWLTEHHVHHNRATSSGSSFSNERARRAQCVYDRVAATRQGGERESRGERGRERGKKTGFLSIVARFRLPEGSTQSVVQFWCKTACLAVWWGQKADDEGGSFGCGKLTRGMTGRRATLLLLTKKVITPECEVRQRIVKRSWWSESSLAASVATWPAGFRSKGSGGGRRAFVRWIVQVQFSPRPAHRSAAARSELCQCRYLSLVASSRLSCCELADPRPLEVRLQCELLAWLQHRLHRTREIFFFLFCEHFIYIGPHLLDFHQTQD